MANPIMVTKNLGKVRAVIYKETAPSPDTAIWYNTLTHQKFTYNVSTGQWEVLGSGEGGGGTAYEFVATDSITPSFIDSDSVKFDLRRPETPNVRDIISITTEGGVQALEHISAVTQFNYNSSTGVLSLQYIDEAGITNSFNTTAIITSVERAAISHTNRAALDMVSGVNTGNETYVSITNTLGGTPIFTSSYGLPNGTLQLDSNGYIPNMKLQNVNTRKYSNPTITLVDTTNTLPIDFGGYNEAWVIGVSDGFVQCAVSTLTIETSNSTNAKSIKLFLRVTAQTTTITFPTIFHPFDTDNTENIYKNIINTLVFKTGYYEIGMDYAYNKWILKATKVAQ